MTPIKLKQDNDGHWFIIPNDLEDIFDTLLKNIDVAYQDEGHNKDILYQLFQDYMWKNHFWFELITIIIAILSVISGITSVIFVFWFAWWWKMLLVSVVVWGINRFVYSTIATDILNSQKWIH